MDCPECGGSLDDYVFDGRKASICERCDWVGIEADHRGEGADVESWDDALDRFYDQHVETERLRADLPPVGAADGEASDTDEEGDDGGNDAGAGTDADGEGGAGAGDDTGGNGDGGAVEDGDDGPRARSDGRADAGDADAGDEGDADAGDEGDATEDDESRGR